MNFLQLKYFLEIARCGNFTYAADRLYLATPSLSKYISSLEEELGFKLFVRKNRGVELTPEGHRLYNAIEQPFHALNMAYDRTISHIRDKKQSISIGVPENELVSPSLMSVCLNYNELYRDKVKFVIHSAPINTLCLGLLDGEFDIVVVNEVYVRTVASVSFYPLGEADTILAVRKDHPFANRENVTLEDLKDECIILTVPKNGYDFVEPVLKFASFASSVLYASSIQSALLNVAAGNGVAIVPDTALGIMDGPFCRLHLPKQINESRYCIAWLTDHANPLVSQFTRNVKDAYENRPESPYLAKSFPKKL